MNIINSLGPALVVAAMALTPLPATAQGRDHENGDRGQAAQRGGRQPQGNRYSAPSQARGYSAPRGQYSAPRTEARGSARQYGGGQREYGAPRGEVRGAPPARGYAAAPRRGYGPRPEARYGYAGPRSYGYAHTAPRYYGHSGYVVAPYRPRFEHPYYAFRPHTHIGFGLWLGFGVPYPTAYLAAYPPPVWGWYGGRFCVVPGARVYGGISFDVAPDWAPVYVDGAYVGVASDYGPYAQPLTLVPGLHRVMISVGGYRPIMWNVTVAAGQVIPFRGGLEAY